jgi:formiminoglutamate deiminase
MVVWCERAWLGGPDVAAGVRIRIDGDRIAEVTPDAPAPGSADASPPATDAVVLRGVTLPGFANVHSHAFQRSLRGRTQRRRGTFWTWREAMYEAAAELTPDDYLALATATFGEMARAGITLVGEFHYLHHGPDGTPYADANAMGHALAQAAANAGVRLTLLDTCYLHGGIGAAVEGVQRRFADASVDAWAARVDALQESELVRIGAAAHSVRALEPNEVEAVAALARERSRPLHAHVSEQRRENDECRTAYGRSPVELLDDAGCLDARFTAVHATHLTDAEIATLGAAAVTCCLCPTTERDLADGIGCASALTAAGAALALGSDSNAVIDVFEEARAVELDERLASEERVKNDPADLLTAASANGYAALGWDGGAIRPGACADLVTVALDSVRLAGTPASDIVPSVVFAAHPTDVCDVMVGGRWIVRDGAHLTLDVATELERVLR